MSNQTTDRPHLIDHQQPLLETMMLTLPADRVQVYDGCVVVFDDVAEPMDFLVNDDRIKDEWAPIGAST